MGATAPEGGRSWIWIIATWIGNEKEAFLETSLWDEPVAAFRMRRRAQRSR
jgi:hypothetical protein